MDTTECAAWAANDPLALSYHDNRWCKPIHDDTELFAMLSLEGMQAGLSWSTILKKEAAIRSAFDGFDIQKASRLTEDDVNRLMECPGIIKNRMKLRSVIKNARCILALPESGYSTFDEYIWHFTDGKQIIHHPKTAADIPSQDDLSRKVSKEMKKLGFLFVGPVIIYSFLQGIGIYDDHLDGCPCKAKHS